MLSEKQQLFVEYYKNMYETGDIDPAIWMMKYIIDRQELNKDQVLWLCFLYGVTYQLPSAYLIWNEYPDLELVDEERLYKWWKPEVYNKIPFQKDKLKQRPLFPVTVLSYQKMLKGKTQSEFFDEILNKSPEENFNLLWDKLYKNIKHFGRFSVWNWVQVLKDVAGYKIKPNTLFLGESNAKTHTCGICLALDMPEKLKHYKFTPKEIYFMNEKTAEMKEAIQQMNIPVDEFSIETVACAYKKIWRNYQSRYTGYYLDRQAEDIQHLQKYFHGVDWDLLWQARQECLDYYMNKYKIDTTRYKEKPAQKILPKITFKGVF